jgi:hypothetical protein
MSGGRDFAADLVAAAEACAIGSWEDAGTTAGRIAAELQRLGYGLGGGLSDGARALCLAGLEELRDYEDEYYERCRQGGCDAGIDALHVKRIADIDSAVREIEAMARVGVRT